MIKISLHVKQMKSKLLWGINCPCKGIMSYCHILGKICYWKIKPKQVLVGIIISFKKNVSSFLSLKSSKLSTLSHPKEVTLKVIECFQLFHTDSKGEILGRTNPNPEHRIARLGREGIYLFPDGWQWTSLVASSASELSYCQIHNGQMATKRRERPCL